MSPFFFVNRRRKRKRNVRGWEGGKERERECRMLWSSLFRALYIYPDIRPIWYAFIIDDLLGQHRRYWIFLFFFCPCYTCCLCVCLCLWNFFFRSIILHATHKFHHTFHAIYFTTGSFKVRSFVQKKNSLNIFSNSLWMNQPNHYIYCKRATSSFYIQHTHTNQCRQY